jgi:hypothetical protein
MSRRILSLAAVVVLAAGMVTAQEPQAKPDQTPKPQARPEQPAPDQPRQPVGQMVNVRIEMTITDQTGPGEPARKMVTMVVADRHNGSIRTSGFVDTPRGRRDVVINADARPAVLKDGLIQLDLGLQYQPTGSAPVPPSPGAGPVPDPAQTGLNERISTIMENGRSMLISQASDPASDRRISLDVKATIVK